MNKTFFITTPIYYASGNLHIGHAYTTTICDTLARYKKMRGFDVFYLTGTDEHGEKVQKQALLDQKTPKQFVDDLVVNIKKLWETLQIDYNYFVRTTDQNHKDTVQRIFTKLLNQGDIYKGIYEGWYCTPCEAFWTESQLNEQHCCPDCGRPVQLAKEESYFFRMSKYADRLVKYYEDFPGFVEPEARKNEMLNTFIKPGLEDLCVSRTSFDWGIPVKEDPKHVVYVWIDALSNYITSLGYDQENPQLFEKYWHNDENHEILHVVGKEIVRFHVIYWPIMLMALGLPLPTKIYGHGWIVMKEGKMSKSKGNVVDPFMLMDRYGLDCLRYYLTRCIPFGQDGVFTPEFFVENINRDLVNDLGNLLSRTVSMILKYFNGVIPNYSGVVGSFDQSLEDEGKKAIKQYEEAMDRYAIDKALDSVFTYIARANKYVDETSPWALAKDPGKLPELESAMYHLANVLKQSALMLQPFLLDAPNKIFEQIGLATATYDTIHQMNELSGCLVKKGNILFPRLDVELEVKYIQEKMQGK